MNKYTLVGRAGIKQKITFSFHHPSLGMDSYILATIHLSQYKKFTLQFQHVIELRIGVENQLLQPSRFSPTTFYYLSRSFRRTSEAEPRFWNHG